MIPRSYDTRQHRKQCSKNSRCHPCITRLPIDGWTAEWQYLVSAANCEGCIVLHNLLLTDPFFECIVDDTVEPIQFIGSCGRVREKIKYSIWCQTQSSLSSSLSLCSDCIFLIVGRVRSLCHRFHLLRKYCHLNLLYVRCYHGKCCGVIWNTTHCIAYSTHCMQANEK